MSALGHIVKAILVLIFRLVQGKEEEPRVVHRSPDAQPLPVPNAEETPEVDLHTDYLPPDEWMEPPSVPSEQSAPAHRVASRLRGTSGLRDAFIAKTILDPPRAVARSGKGDRWRRR